MWKGSHVPIWAGLWGATCRTPVPDEAQSVLVPKTPKNMRLTENTQKLALDPKPRVPEAAEEGKPKHVSQQSNSHFDGYKDVVMIG